MQKLTTFKQALKSDLLPGGCNKTPLVILTAFAVTFTVVFNSLPGHSQTVSDPTVTHVETPEANSDANKPGETGSAVKATDAGSPTSTLSKVVKASDDKMSTARKKEVQPLPNFHKVTDYLYRGGEPNPEGLRQLKDMGVKTLIDLRAQTEAAHNEAALAKKLGMKYINMTMTAEAPTKKQVETLLATIDSAKEKNEPVLVHCAHGSDRTGCMIGIWRVTRDNWSFDDTYKEMRKYYFGVKYDKLRNAVKERATH